MDDIDRIKLDDMNLWCNEYNIKCKEVPNDGRCHKCCSACIACDFD